MCYNIKMKKQEILSQYEAGVTIYGGAASAAHPGKISGKNIPEKIFGK